ncbi:MAG TPA: hypothetical protein VKV25_08475 [Acidimicrobiales bacterium]|nr:hypothetical protein [Acidimicrobiales bacterium]
MTTPATRPVWDRAAAEEGLDPSSLDFVARARVAANRLAHRASSPEDPAAAVAQVRLLGSFDADVPTASRQAVLRYLKRGIKPLTAWYLRYLTQQLTAFAEGVADLGDVLARRAEQFARRDDELERHSEAMAARLEALQRRVTRLEAALGPAGGEPAGSGRASTGQGSGKAPTGQ